MHPGGGCGSIVKEGMSVSRGNMNMGRKWLKEANTPAKTRHLLHIKDFLETNNAWRSVLAPEPSVLSCLMLSATMSLQERLGRVLKTTLSAKRGPEERGDISLPWREQDLGFSTTIPHDQDLSSFF